MSRKRTGLRNRFRTGRGTYSRMKKARMRDIYGTPRSGACEDIICGHALRYPIGIGKG